MNKTLSIYAAAALATLGLAAQAQEISGRVISSTPVVQQVQVPRSVCINQPVAVQQPRSGAGAVIGAIAGAALGNAIGHGSGRAAATGLGLVGGAALGDRVEGGGTAIQNVQQCNTETYYENRTVAYNVTYEHDGQQYTVQMPSDPGPSIRLRLSPVGSASPLDANPMVGGSDGISAPLGTPIVPAVVASARTVYPGYPVYPAYSQPAYPIYYPAAPAYYPPVGVSLNFGFVGGGWHGHRGHRSHRGHRGHWR